MAGITTRFEHIVTEPISEQMTALFIIAPVRENGIKWNEDKESENGGKGDGSSVNDDPESEGDRQDEAKQTGHPQDGKHRFVINADDLIKIEGASNRTAEE